MALVEPISPEDPSGGLAVGRADRLVRASVGAFCTVTRPTRREAAQLDDLVMPLYAQLAPSTLRYLSAALSECAIAPTHLVRRLANEPIEIAAPVLARSVVLSETDLVAIAGRQGMRHFYAMLHRPGLTDKTRRVISEAAARRDLPRIEAIAPSPEAQDQSTDMPLPAIPSQPAAADPVPETTSDFEMERPRPDKTPLAIAGENAEKVRQKLRAMMEPSTATSDRPRLRRAEGGAPLAAADYPKLRSAALTGVPALFQTALADALDIDFQRARDLFGASGYFDLLAALRALSLTGEQAFVLAAAAYPAQFPHAEAIRIFLDRFALLHVEAAMERVRAWRVETASAALRARQQAGDDRSASMRTPEPARILKAG